MLHVGRGLSLLVFCNGAYAIKVPGWGERNRDRHWSVALQLRHHQPDLVVDSFL